VFEGFGDLPLEGGEVGFELLESFRLPLGCEFERTKGVLDALDGSDRIGRVQRRRIGPFAAHEK
jgi:hypothetical protein